MERLVIRLVRIALLGVVLSLASCGSNGNDNGAGPTGSAPSPWEACVVGQILASGTDPCTYPNRSEVLSVNESGEACLDAECGDGIRVSRSENGQTVLDIEVAAIGGGFYGITQLGSQTKTVREIRKGPGSPFEPCQVGSTLGPGASCCHDDGTNFFVFEVKSDGDGCVGGLCSGSSLSLNDFSATKSGGTWTIESLP